MNKELYKKIASSFTNPCQDYKLQDFIESCLPSYECKQDELGNVICKKGTGKKHILISSHIDEVGFRVTYISKEGHIYFQSYGKIKQDVAVGQIVRILTRKGEMFGIVAKQKTSSITPSTPFEELWIDVGNSEEVEKNVQIGDFILFDTTFYDLMPSYAMSRGGDNKLGLFAAIQCLQNIADKIPKDVTVYFAATTQEEIGSRGIETVMHRIEKLNKCLIIDTTESSDTPGANIKKQGEVSLQKGIVLTRSPNVNRAFFNELQAITQKNKIPLQIIAKAEKTSTDARATQTSGDGTLTALISIPLRYMHFPAQVFNWDDVEHAIRFLEAFILSQ